MRSLSQLPYVAKGGRVTLRCDLYSWNPSQKPRVQWQFNGRVLSGVTGAEYVIDSVDPVDHEGSYVCEGTDAVTTKASEPFFLPIKCKFI